jgi:hypothetical protein
MFNDKKLIVLCLLAVGCGTTWHPYQPYGDVANEGISIRGPNGESWKGIDCSGRSQITCLVDAGNICPDGYDVIENNNHSAIEASGNSTSGISGSGNFIFGHGSSRMNSQEVYHGYMIISCHARRDGGVYHE